MLRKSSNRKAVRAITQTKGPEYFGENVFNRKALKKYLSLEGNLQTSYQKTIKAESNRA
jgi:hypothetical protein